MVKIKWQQLKDIRMTMTKKRAALYISGLLVALMMIGALIPDGPSPYFEPIGERSFQEDEKGQWAYVKWQYRRMDASGDLFMDWDPEFQYWWKYAIAFLGYGMPSLALIDPDNKKEYLLYFSIMIDKMKSKQVWDDWQRFGFGEDPLCVQNIMYKGHLNLMYGLYQLMSGDERYSKEYRWLTEQIVNEIRDNEDKKRVYQGVVCEPNQYFIHCNAIGLLSLHIYDRLYNTNYTQVEVRKTLDYISTRLADPETGLFWKVYHPSHDVATREISGYTNAWALALLKVFNPEKYTALYPVWKKMFVVEIGPFVYVKEAPNGGPNRVATIFGMLAAKEFNDKELFDKMAWTVDTVGFLKGDLETDQKRYLFVDDTLLNGMMLSFKAHVGFDTILDGFQVNTNAEIPKTKDMTWLDVLRPDVKYRNAASWQGE